MNLKKLSIGFIFLIIGLSVLPITGQFVEKSSLPLSRDNWLYVGGSGPSNYTTIQDAINDSYNGDTVFVFNGTYFGHIYINKSINLFGENKNNTLIIGYFAYTISIVTDKVNMSGFRIQNGGRLGEGIRIDSSNNTFVNNIIEIPNDRIRIFGHNNIFSDNIIIESYLFLTGNYNIISGNTITDNKYGIYLIDSWNNMILGNSFFNSGLFISSENICNNLVINNTVNNKPLIYLYNQSNLLLNDDAGQIVLVNCTNITIHNQKICNTTAGIQILGSNTCGISGNILTGNRYGVYLHGWDNNINDNTITNNDNAICLSGESNTIFRNTIADNDNGIYLDYSTNNNIINNTITNNSDSIRMDFGGDFNDIINNTIINNEHTISLFGDQNTIIGNTILNNNDEGINLVFSDSNIIVNNIIQNNKGNGINAENSNYNNFLHNTIAQNDDGISLFSSINNNINGNNISSNTEHGIFLYSCIQNTIIDNNISNNGVIGISFDHSYYNNISNNSIISNYEEGILLIESSNNSIRENNLLENEDGIELQDSNDNIIIENIINSNNDHGIEGIGSSIRLCNNNTIKYNIITKNNQGIYLEKSNNNTILKNNLLKNQRNALFNNCINTWNQNYWNRPRILPKLIFGTIDYDPFTMLWFNIDWHPALKPYDIP